ncbi:MAG: TetR/AcrR family transcriptional regulator, partial [Planctomycetota bacterium]
VRVERLARDLGVAKSGFYWHFRDRDDLLRGLLRYWAHEFTDVVREDPRIRAERPLERLRGIMEMVVDHDLTRYDLAMRSWAARDPRAARAFRRVYKTRLDFVGAAFAELGFKGDELEMRTRLFVCHQSWEKIAFGGSKQARRRFMDRRLRLLTQK